MDFPVEFIEELPEQYRRGRTEISGEMFELDKKSYIRDIKRNYWNNF